MKKLFLLLSVIALASCSSDDVDNCKLQQSVSAANYKVDAKDIKMVIADYFSLFGTRSGGIDYNVLHIDTIGKFASAATRSSKEDTDPLLYAVKISDGSTIIVGGDKRAESIYARFNNVDLKIDENGQFTNDSIPDMVYYLIEDYMADVKNKIKNNASLNSFYCNSQDFSSTRATEDDEEVSPKLSYRFSDAYNYNEKNNNYNLFTSQDVRPCVAIRQLPQ